MKKIILSSAMAGALIFATAGLAKIDTGIEACKLLNNTSWKIEGNQLSKFFPIDFKVNQWRLTSFSDGHFGSISITDNPQDRWRIDSVTCKWTNELKVKLVIKATIDPKEDDSGGRLYLRNDSVIKDSTRARLQIDTKYFDPQNVSSGVIPSGSAFYNSEKIYHNKGVNLILK